MKKRLNRLLFILGVLLFAAVVPWVLGMIFWKQLGYVFYHSKLHPPNYGDYYGEGYWILAALLGLYLLIHYIVKG